MPSEMLRYESGLLAALLPVLREELDARIKGSLSRLPPDLSALVEQENVPDAESTGSARQRRITIYAGVPRGTMVSKLATPYLRIGFGPGGYLEVGRGTTAGSVDNFWDARMEVITILAKLVRQYHHDWTNAELVGPASTPPVAAPAGG